jgi:metal-responsive CopG/Arc/MetJ family transcriptional regulator
MGSQRAHIILPQELIEEIDAVVGPRGRSAFLVETARAELRRRPLHWNGCDRRGSDGSGG